MKHVCVLNKRQQGIKTEIVKLWEYLRVIEDWFSGQLVFNNMPFVSPNDGHTDMPYVYRLPVPLSLSLCLLSMDILELYHSTSHFPPPCWFSIFRWLIVSCRAHSTPRYTYRTAVLGVNCCGFLLSPSPDDLRCLQQRDAPV